MAWPALAALLPELLIGGGMIASQWLAGSSSKWARRSAPVVSSAGFLGSGLLRPDWDDGYVETFETQGFNPKTWGKDVGGSPYGMGY